MKETFKEAVPYLSSDDLLVLDKLRHEMLKKNLSSREHPNYPDIPLEDIRTQDMIAHMENNYYGLKEAEFLSWFKAIFCCLQLGDSIHIITRGDMKAKGVTKNGGGYVTFSSHNHLRFVITNIDYEICRMDGLINGMFKIENVFCDEFKVAKCFFTYTDINLPKYLKDVDNYLDKEFNLKDSHSVYGTCGEIVWNECLVAPSDELPF